MTDVEKALIRAHEANVRRYQRILGTKLTALERAYVKRRLREERDEIARLKSDGANFLITRIGVEPGAIRDGL